MTFFSFLLKKKFPGRGARAELLAGPLTVSRLLWHILAAAGLILLYLLLLALNSRALATVPAHGGTITEGIIGAPRFINPVLAATDTDVALAALVYAGLVKEYGDGTIVPELAKEYHLSPDGRTYTFLLRDKLFFHDHSPVTSSDVAFTIEKLQDAALNPRSAAFWQTVSVSTPDKATVIVTIPSPDETFLQKMTVGIMPFELWQGIEGEAFAATSLNLFPVGAGAFRIADIATDESGTPKKISLVRHRAYPLGAPLLKGIEIAVFTNQESLLSAMKSGAIDLTFALAPASLPEGTFSSDIAVSSIPTTARMELFLHRSSSALANASLLALFNQYVDKAAIIDRVENGYGIPHDSTGSAQDAPPSLEDALERLSSLGYALSDGVLSKNGTPVALAIATHSAPRYIEAGRALSEQLAALGVIVDVQAFDPGTFQSELAAQSFPLVLTDDASLLPDAYITGIPLYTTATPLAADPRVQGVAQGALDSPALRYATAPDWHAKTEQLYPFLIRLLTLEERT